VLSPVNGIAPGQADQAFSRFGAKYANVEDGWMGMAFIKTCIESSANKAAWTAMPKKV
jgi:hypothetical protein